MKASHTDLNYRGPMQGNGKRLASFASYVPNLVLSHGLTGLSAPKLEARVLQARGSALYISFDLLPHAIYTLQGDAHNGSHLALKTLQNSVTTFFHPLLQIIHSRGGDVIRLSASAILCCWIRAKAQTDVTAILRTIECAKAVRRFLSSNIPEIKANYGIGYGCFNFLHVGGFRNQFRLVVTGPPIHQAASALQVVCGT